MSEIRLAHLLRRTVGLAAAPALLLTAAACGGDDGGDSSFCDAANEVNDTFKAIDDPTSEEYDAAIEQLESLDPPPAIADDWDLMLAMLDPEAAADVDFDESEAAADRVGTYLYEECGIEAE